MKSIQALREQRAAKGAELKALVEKEGEFAAEDQSAYEAGIAEVDRIDAEIERIEAVHARLADDTRNVENVIEAAKRVERDSGKSTKVFQKWLRGGDKALNNADWEEVRAAMSTGSETEGGFTVDSDVTKSVIDSLKAYGGMRNLATVLQTEGGNALSFPKSDGTNEIGEIVPENAAATDEDVSFASVGLPVFKYSSKVVTVPWELLQDSSIDVESFVRGRLVTRLGRITNRHFVIGTGNGQPTGVQVGATVGKTGDAGTATTVDYDMLVDLQHSVDPAYRNGKDGWLMNDKTLAAVRKIKDSNGRPIFVPGYETGPAGGAPDTLLGRPIYINQDMPDLGAAKKAILYGDFSGYYIRDVMGVTMFRFDDSAYAKRGQVGFLAWLRSGGNLIDGNAIRALKQGTAS